ncbi:hypothetical protein Daus18300_011310 [Diaporthe australafricana]|uniref:Mitotic apparatus protein p62 n=1 Tax=Diaporthe australafricana TaxID=127596 RepID=A0ABR3W794_9PEZI
MSLSPTWLRVPHKHGPILVRVVPRTSSSNSRPLDLHLTATDSEEAFVLILQHSKISRYRDKASPLSDDEWESCLTSLLLGTQPIGHLHVSADFVQEDLSIKIGNKVSGATNIAGTLVLRHSKSATEDISVFDWANEAVLQQTQLAGELAELKHKHGELRKLVTEETAHIKALERSKHEFESEHDSFFRDLLNEKKLKIRTQEQILSTAHVDEAKLAALSVKSKPHAVGSSRKGKRKAESLGHDADDDDADKMDVDEQSDSPDQELSDVEQTTEEETASEPDPEPKPQPKSKKPTRLSGGKKDGGGYSPSSSKSATKPNKPPSSNLRGKTTAVAAGDGDEDMPAPRALPFVQKVKPVPDPADDESTASES